MDAIGWLWLDQATHCAVALRNGRLNNTDRNFRLGKLRACRFFFEYEMPRITAWLSPIRIASRVSATMPLEQFLGEMT